MKNIIILIISVLFYACDPNYDTSFLLKNATNDTIDVVLYSLDKNEKKQIIPNSELLLLHSSGMSGGPTKLSMDGNDSIFVSRKNGIIKYYRDSATNQIYNMDNWILKKIKKHVYTYTFEFNEADFK